jgi:hypothetical protein
MYRKRPDTLSRSNSFGFERESKDDILEILIEIGLLGELFGEVEKEFGLWKGF